MRVNRRAIKALHLESERPAPAGPPAGRQPPAQQPPKPDTTWKSPIPLGEAPVPAFPVEILPAWLGNFVRAEAVATQTPADLAAMLVLAVVSAACAGKMLVRLKDGYEEPLNVFTMVVLAPGNRKSAVFRDATGPVGAFEQEEAERLRESVASALQERRVLDARLKAAEERAAKAKDNERSNLIEEAQRVRRERDSLMVPVQPRLIVDDCSPEKLASLLHEQGGRIALLSPEGDVFDIMSGRYSSNSAPNLGVYLKGHAGDPLRVDRQGRSSEFVSSPALTIGLAIQPEVLQGLMARPGFRGRGLLARFLYSVPMSTLGHRDVEAQPVPAPTRAAYEEGILRILKIPFGTRPDGMPGPHALRLDAEARQVFLEFERRLEPQLGEYGGLAHIADWAAKLVGAIGRIAGLLHMAELVGHRSPWEVPVDRACAERAIRVGEYLMPHAQAAFGQMGADPKIEDARYLLGWLERGDLRSFTKRDAFQATKGRFKQVSDLEPALDLLEECNYVRAQADKPRGGAGRKPSPTYEVNPRLHAHYSRNPQNGPPVMGCEDSENIEQGDRPSKRPRGEGQPAPEEAEEPPPQGPPKDSVDGPAPESGA